MRRTLFFISLLLRSKLLSPDISDRLFLISVCQLPGPEVSSCNYIERQLHCWFCCSMACSNTYTDVIMVVFQCIIIFQYFAILIHFVLRTVLFLKKIKLLNEQYMEITCCQPESCLNGLICYTYMCMHSYFLQFILLQVIHYMFKTWFFLELFKLLN